MPLPPIDPSMATNGVEWSVAPVQPTEAAAGGEGFGDMLSNAIGSLQKTQTEAAEASHALATGTATDPTQVVMAVERARLSMQMASQIRGKAVEAYNDIFHTTV